MWIELFTRASAPASRARVNNAPHFVTSAKTLKPDVELSRAAFRLPFALTRYIDHGIRNCVPGSIRNGSSMPLCSAITLHQEGERPWRDAML